VGGYLGSSQLVQRDPVTARRPNPAFARITQRWHGVPVMFIPVLLFGVFSGAAYIWFLRVLQHRELAVALVTVVFWMNLYLFERSWAKMMGLSLTMMVYLGGLSFLIDRWLLMRATAGESAASLSLNIRPARSGMPSVRQRSSSMKYVSATGHCS